MARRPLLDARPSDRPRTGKDCRGRVSLWGRGMGSIAPTERYRFGPFELQPDKRRLLKDGATISLRPRAFDLLVALVDRAGHLVTKDELLDQVWPKMVVEEAALHVQVSALRKVLARRRRHHHGVGRRLPIHPPGDDGRRRSESPIELEAQ